VGVAGQETIDRVALLRFATPRHRGVYFRASGIYFRAHLKRSVLICINPFPGITSTKGIDVRACQSSAQSNQS
jgi:hypothetical protein